jgi:hypothetical protein
MTLLATWSLNVRCRVCSAVAKIRATDVVSTTLGHGWVCSNCGAFSTVHMPLPSAIRAQALPPRKTWWQRLRRWVKKLVKRA